MQCEGLFMKNLAGWAVLLNYTYKAIGAGRTAMTRFLTTALTTEEALAEWGGPVLKAIDAVAWVTTLVVMDLSVQGLALEKLKSAAMCVIQATNEYNKYNCVNGFKEYGECRPCPQIEDMKDYEISSKYKDKYKMQKDLNPGTVQVSSGQVQDDNNLERSYVVDHSNDPIVTGKLTSLVCDADDLKAPVYANRPFPVGTCGVYNKTTGLEYPDGPIGKKFLNSDIRLCLPDSGSAWDTDFITDGNYDWHYVPLDYARQSSPEAAECAGRDMTGWSGWGQMGAGTEPEDGLLHCLWGHVGEVGDVENWIERVGGGGWDRIIDEMGDITLKAYPPTATRDYQSTQNNTLDQYDGSNVCLSNFQMAGDYIRDRKHNRKYSSEEVKNASSPVWVSNHCCPKIIGGRECPLFESGTVTHDTTKDEFKGNLGMDEESTDNCYLLRNPEFISNEYRNTLSDPIFYDYNSNSEYTGLRAGGIQCGPRDREIASSTPFNSRDSETYLDDSTVKVIKKTGQFYGTRFKFDNRYGYDWDEDSGATGYENYLDPGDYVPLKTSEGSKYDSGSVNRVLDYSDFRVENENTTLNDVIAKELGHPDRNKLFCDNITCNDLEKTKYMQTLYDGFCTNITRKPSPINTYKKFYRPVGINKEGGNVSDTFPTEDWTEERKMYPDICCDPIHHSNKSSFVGCDARGHNSYFIDGIIEEYNNESSPTLPLENKSRRRIHPQGKQNLNQCIPSMEARCDVSVDYFRDSPNPYDYLRHKDTCSNKLDKYNLNLYLKGTDLEEFENNKSLGDLCSGQGEDYYCDVSYPQRLLSSPFHLFNKEEYWTYNRLSAGYAPSKGDLSDWTSEPVQGGNIFSLNPPSPRSVYTECHPINPYSNVYDIEIYNKQFDMLPWNGSTSEKYLELRYTGDNPPTNIEDHIKINCRNYEDVNGEYFYSEPRISSPILKPNYSQYNIECVEVELTGANNDRYVRVT